MAEVASLSTSPTVQCNVDWERLQQALGDEFCRNECTVDELSGGTINYVFRITTKKDSSVIVKQAHRYMKCAGPELPMSVKRNQIEYSMLTLFNGITPGSAPKQIFCDVERSYYVMEDLHDYIVFQETLQQMNQFSLSAIQDATRNIAKLHRSTHKNNVTTASHANLTECTKNEQFREIIVCYVFDDMNRPDNIARHSPEVRELFQLIKTDPLIVTNQKKIRTLMTTRHDCLIHGDLHTGSILMKGDSAKLIDFEISHVGLAAEDIGYLVANYAFAYLERTVYPCEHKPSFHCILKEITEKTVELYFDDAAEYLTPEQFAATVAETAGFAGCMLVRRILGRPENPGRPELPLVEAPCLQLGISLITPKDLIEHLFYKPDIPK